MSTHRTRAALVPAFVLAGSLLVVPPAAQGAAGAADRHPPSPDSGQVVLDWERLAFATVYSVPPAPELPTPVPIGAPILGYTAMAMHDAVRASVRVHDSSETAAVATAAHDVLAHHVPRLAGTLDDALEDSLLDVPDGAAKDRGERIGAKVAARLLADRDDDGYGDTSIHYTLPAGVGVWQPVPGGDMTGAWIGSMRPLVVRRLARVDGPDRLTSDDYATDYNEVKLLGSETSTVRTQAQTDTSRFFSANAAVMVPDGLVRYLETHPVSLEETAWTFAAIHGAVTDSLIKCWRLKRDVGFWRPVEAIPRAAEDENPDTQPEAGWIPLLKPTPNYSDYVSGHGCATSPAVEVIRARFGETTPIELRSGLFPTAPRTYATLSQLEHDALHARIWGGLHFRDAMTDAYAIGRRTARAVMAELD